MLQRKLAEKRVAALPDDAGLGPRYSAVMGVFLLFVTGIPYTEMRAVKSKGEAYKQYQRETSAFIPWFPKQVEQA